MKTFKILATLAIHTILAQQSFAQDVANDTVMAKICYEKAILFQDSTKYDSANVYFEKASALYQEHGQWRKYLQSETKHGECFQKQWQMDMAIATIKPAIEKTLKHSCESDTIFADAYHILGLQFLYQSKNDSTLFYWEKTLKIRKEIFGEKHAKVAASYNNIGGLKAQNDEYDAALEYIAKSLEISLELFGENHTNVAAGYGNMGIIYGDKNEYDLALQNYLKALEILKKIHGEDHPLVATSYNNIGNIYHSKYEYDLALQYFFKAIQIRKELFSENHVDVAMTYNNIANVYRDKNEYDLALEYHNKNVQIFKELLGEKHMYLATSYNNIGTIYTLNYEYDLALQFYFKALQIRKELFGENHSSIASSYNNIANVYDHITENDKALEYYFKSLEIGIKIFGEKHRSVSSNYTGIGLAYDNKNEYDLALQYHMKALQIDKELFGEKNMDVARNYNNIANVYYHKLNFDEALDYYSRSLEISKGLLGDKNLDVARTYNNIALLYYQNHDYNLALQYFQNTIEASLRNFDDSGNVYSVPIIEDYLNWPYLLQAMQGKAHIFTDTEITLPKLELALHLYQACDTLLNQVRQSVLTEFDKIVIGEKAYKVYEGAISVSHKLIAIAKPDKVLYYKNLAFYFSEKNKSSVLLEALAGAEAQKFVGIPDSLLKKEHKLQIDIALYKRLLAEKPDSTNEITFRDKLFNASRNSYELIAFFESQYPEYFELKYNNKPASVKEIQNLLDEETAIISYFTGDTIITIFTITKENLDIKTVPTCENFADTIRDYHFGLLYVNSSKYAKSYKKYAYKMHQQLIPEKLNKEIKNLIIIPDVFLSRIPFETLLTENPEGKEWKELPYLIKKYNISYSYSANLFFKTFPKEAASKPEHIELNDWIALAPVFNDASTAGLTMRSRELLRQFDTELNDTITIRSRLVDGQFVSPLPGTETEVKEIYNEFDKKDRKALVQLKQNANEKFIKEGGLKNYKLIHFATHGVVNFEHPELSGILLAQDSTASEDGILYSGEFYNLDLNADLTVLSACETGLGEIYLGEGLIGLSRALLYAGSKNIIVSLWKVSDNSTSDLMIDFYKNLLNGEQEKQEFSKPLREAKLKMIDEGTYAHPFYWSPFILIGK